MFKHKLDTQSELKLLELAEADELFALMDKNRAVLREWLPWLDYNKAVSDSKAFIENSLKAYEAKEQMTVGIWHQGRLAGVASYHKIDQANKKVSIGYWVGAEFQGKGLAAKATRALTENAFNNLGLNRVEVLCATGNLKSQKIPRSLGFQEEGILRQNEWLYDHFVDHYCFSMLKEEWPRLSN